MEKEKLTAELKTFHICWFIGKDEHGLDLTTGKTVQSYSMMEALAEFVRETDINPFYIVEK